MYRCFLFIVSCCLLHHPLSLSAKEELQIRSFLLGSFVKDRLIQEPFIMEPTTSPSHMYEPFILVPAALVPDMQGSDVMAVDKKVRDELVLDKLTDVLKPYEELEPFRPMFNLCAPCHLYSCHLHGSQSAPKAHHCQSKMRLSPQLDSFCSSSGLSLNLSCVSQCNS